MADKYFGGIKAGSTSVSIYILVRKKADSTEATAIAFGDAGNLASYSRQGAARVAIALATQTVTGAFSSGGFIQIDATNMPGLYRLDIPDAALAAGADYVDICFVSTNNFAYHERIALSSDVIQTVAQTGDAYARLGVPVGASISADIQTRSTFAGGAVSSVTGNVGGNIIGSLSATERQAIADALLARNQQGGGNASPTVSQALAGGLMELAISGGVLTVKNGDGTTAYTRTLTRATLDAIVGSV